MLVAVFFGVRSSKIMSEGKTTTFAQDFKAGARTASFLSVLIAIITYVYYAKIDSKFIDKELKSYTEEYKDYQKEHFCSFSILPKNKNLSELSESEKKQYEIDLQECINTYPSKINIDGAKEARKDLVNRYVGKIYFLTPYNQASTTMFALVLLGLMHSLIMTYLMRKMPGFKQ